MKEGGEEEIATPSQKHEEIKFEDPYNYEFLLDRINTIIKKNNTYSSTLA